MVAACLMAFIHHADPEPDRQQASQVQSNLMSMTTSNGRAKIQIWTDGSCWPNPNGPGGWACVLKFDQHRKELSGHIPSTTNNRSEVTALIEALKALNRPCQVFWMTDSTYAMSCIKNKTTVKHWRRAKNRDLLEELQRIMKLGGHEVEAVWVRGHAGHEENERCDQLAEQAREKLVPVNFRAAA